MNLQQRVEQLRENICRAAQNSGRAAQDITLVAVTKAMDAVHTAALLSLGVRHIGENRVQSLQDKMTALDLSGVNVHFIGNLQTNKAKYLVGEVACIQSVDRPALAVEIDRLAGQRGLRQQVLLEVNIGREEQKGGCLPEQLPDFLAGCRALPGIDVAGLMAIPPFGLDEKELRGHFRAMRTLFDRESGLHVLSKIGRASCRERV